MKKATEEKKKSVVSEEKTALSGEKPPEEAPETNPKPSGQIPNSLYLSYFFSGSRRNRGPTKRERRCQRYYSSVHMIIIHSLYIILT